MNWQDVGDRSWGDRPVIVVGAGRSLAGFDLTQLRDLGRVVAVNGALHDLPFADACVSIDRLWAPLNKTAIDEFAGEFVWAIPPSQSEWANPVPKARVVRRRRRCDGLSDDPREIEAAGTSGHGALNYVYLRGAKLIYLFGFDYDGGGHYCQERYSHEANPRQNDRYWPRWALNFDYGVPQLERAGVRVVNASLGSNIRAFSRCTPDTALAELRRLSR